MITFDLPMPKNCMYCMARMDCIVYREWLKSETPRRCPKPLKDDRCMIVEEKGEHNENI